MNRSKQKAYIKLTKLGNREHDVLTVLSKIQGLKDTPEQLIATIPCYISDDVSRSLAEKVKMYLEKAGAIVEIEDETRSEFREPLISPIELAEEEPDVLLFEISGDEVSGTEFDDEDDDTSEIDPVEIAISTISQTSLSIPKISPDITYAERFDEVAEHAEDLKPGGRRRSHKPKRSKSPRSLTLGIILLMVSLLGIGLWMYLSGNSSVLSQQYTQNSTLGQTGILNIDNPAEAELRLYHVIGTRVIKQIQLQGTQLHLNRGDYYLEAQKGTQTIQFPVYIHGRGHKLTVTVSFPAKLPFSGKLVYIPPGWFRMGNKETEVAHFGFPDEKPDIDVYVSGFLLSKYEVTNREFREFLQAGGYSNDVYWERLIRDWPSLIAQVPSYGRVYGNDGWDSVKKYIRSRFIDTDDRMAPRLWEADDPPYEYGQDHYPVIGITLYEADAYCQWMTRETGRVHRLPTEAEWEKAARGYEGYFFSYGNEYDPERANTETEGPKKVGSYPPNSYGLYDMAGNVWEWISDQYRPNTYQIWYDTDRQKIRDPRMFDETKRYDRVIVRGGSFRSVNRINARTPVRYPMFPNYWHTNIGFRYVVIP